MSDNQTQQNEQNQQPAESTPDLTALIDPKNGLILGKWKTAEEARKGYWSAVEEMNTAKSTAENAVRFASQLESQRANPAERRSQRPDYVERLETLGIPTGDLDKLVEDRARTIAQAQFEQQFAPLVRGMQARATMVESYPDFAQTEPQVMEFLERSPQVKARFDTLLNAGFPAEALELAYFNYKQFGAPAQPAPEQRAAKVSAGFPQGAGGINRVSGMNTGPTQQEFEAAQEALSMGKNPGPLMELLTRDIPLTYTERMEALMRAQNQ